MRNYKQGRYATRTSTRWDDSSGMHSPYRRGTFSSRDSRRSVRYSRSAGPSPSPIGYNRDDGDFSDTTPRKHWYSKRDFDTSRPRHRNRMSNRENSTYRDKYSSKYSRVDDRMEYSSPRRRSMYSGSRGRDTRDISPETRRGRSKRFCSTPYERDSLHDNLKSRSYSQKRYNSTSSQNVREYSRYGRKYSKYQITQDGLPSKTSLDGLSHRVDNTFEFDAAIKSKISDLHDILHLLSSGTDNAAALKRNAVTIESEIEDLIDKKPNRSRRDLQTILEVGALVNKIGSFNESLHGSYANKMRMSNRNRRRYHSRRDLYNYHSTVGYHER